MEAEWSVSSVGLIPVQPLGSRLHYPSVPRGRQFPSSGLSWEHGVQGSSQGAEAHLGFRHFQNNLPKRRPGAAVSRLSHSVMKAVFQR
jgi:hypothetical protein